MGHKDIANQTVLVTDSPGDEKKIRAILSAWNIDSHAIDRIIKIHNAGLAHPDGKRPQLFSRNTPSFDRV